MELQWLYALPSENWTLWGNDTTYCSGVPLSERWKSEVFDGKIAYDVDQVVECLDCNFLFCRGSSPSQVDGRRIPRSCRVKNTILDLSSRRTLPSRTPARVYLIAVNGNWKTLRSAAARGWVGCHAGERVALNYVVISIFSANPTLRIIFTVKPCFFTHLQAIRTTNSEQDYNGPIYTRTHIWLP